MRHEADEACGMRHAAGGRRHEAGGRRQEVPVGGTSKVQAISHAREHARTQGGASTGEGAGEGVGESACNDNMACGRGR